MDLKNKESNTTTKHTEVKMSKQTAMQELKSLVQNIIGEMNGQLSQYDIGYKECLIGLMNDINYTFIKMEREQIQDAFYHGVDIDAFNVNNKWTEAEKYYEQTHGG